MFKKILYPTDFSDAATKALGYIKQLKEAGSQEVVLLHVINQRIIDGLMRHAMLEKDIMQWRNKAEEIAQESLMETGKQLEEIGFSVKRIVKAGFPWDVILDVEKKEDPSILLRAGRKLTRLWRDHRNKWLTRLEATPAQAEAVAGSAGLATRERINNSGRSIRLSTPTATLP